MIGKIIIMIACIMCAIPFMIISHYWKDGPDPINFWSGDESLKDKVKDMKGYNAEMASLYTKVAIAFVLAGVLCFINTIAGVVLLVIECTFGVYFVYRVYKKILTKYS